MFHLEIENRQDDIQITDEIISQFHEIIELVLDVEGIESECEISLSFVKDSEIQEINMTHRGIDKPTDVLSFPQYDSLKDEDEVDEEIILGDIVISAGRVVSQALEFGHTIERELCYLFTHSMFHLFGYDHDTLEKQREMRQMEEYVMETIGITRPMI